MIRLDPETGRPTAEWKNPAMSRKHQTLGAREISLLIKLYRDIFKGLNWMILEIKAKDIAQNVIVRTLFPVEVNLFCPEEIVREGR